MGDAPTGGPPARLGSALRRGEAWIALAMLASTLVVWWGVRDRPDLLFRYWDGPNYMYAAKVFHRVPPDHPFAAIGLARSEFATRLPAYPASIRALTLVTGGDYRAAMLLATLVSSVAAAVLFYRLLVEWQLVASPLWTALLFCFLPPRWLLYHSVGASEPLFACFVFGAFLALGRGRTWGVIACVALASLTRITGVLLVPVFGVIYGLRREWRRAALQPVALAGLGALFTLHHFAFGDFFAYFTVNATERSVVQWPPFAVVRWYALGARPHTTELLLVLYALYALGTANLWPRRELFVYSATLFAFHCFVFHEDLSRYLLSIAPFSLLVGFDETLRRPIFRWIAPLLVVGSYLYAWGMLPGNAMAPEPFEGVMRALQ